jgi:hypothetical protein
MTAVKFIRDHDRYMRGEVAGFRPTEAERLVRRKIVRHYKTPAEATTPAASPPELAGRSASEMTAGDDPREAFEIPDDWRDLSWPARRSLASTLTENPIVSGDDAEQAILAELARRAR